MNSEGVRRLSIAVGIIGIIGWLIYLILVKAFSDMLSLPMIAWFIIFTGFIVCFFIPYGIVKGIVWVVDGFKSRKEIDIKKEEPILRKCEFCAEKIQADAIKCKHCGEWLNRENKQAVAHDDTRINEEKSDYEQVELSPIQVQAERHIRNARIMVSLTAVGMLLTGLLGYNNNPVNSLTGAAVLLLCSFGISKKSKVISIIAMIFFLGILITAILTMNILFIFIPIVMNYFMIQGVRGIFVYHELQKNNVNN